MRPCRTYVNLCRGAGKKSSRRLLTVMRHCVIVAPVTDELLTSTQAGAMLGKSARTVQRMVDAGTLTPAQKLPGPNGAYLFLRADVEALTDEAAA